MIERDFIRLGITKENIRKLKYEYLKRYGIFPATKETIENAFNRPLTKEEQEMPIDQFAKIWRGWV